MSLNRLMLILFGSAIAVLSIWQWGYVFISTDPAFDAQVERQLTSVATSRTERINDFFKERIQDTDFLVASPEIKRLLAEKLSQDNDRIAPNLKKRQDILAKRLEIFIRKYPKNTFEDFKKNDEFRNLAVQMVGFSGNTYLIEEGGKTIVLDNFRSGASGNEEEFLTLDATPLEVRTADGLELALATRWFPADFKVLPKTGADEKYLEFFERSGGYRNIFLVSSSGDIALAAEASLDLGENLDFASQKDSYLKQAFDSAKKSRKVEIVGPYMDTAAGGSERAVLYAAPVYDVDNFLGMAVLETDMNEIENIMKENSGLGNTGEAYLVDQRGFLITPFRHRDATLLAQKIITDNAKHCLEQIQHGDTADRVRVSYFSDYKGDEAIGTYGTVNTPKWCSVAEISAGEVFDLPKSGKKATAAAAIAMVAVIAMLIFGFASYRWNKDQVILPGEKYYYSFERFPFKYVLFGGLLALAIITLALHFASMK